VRASARAATDASAAAFTPVNVDFVAWREALMAVVRQVRQSPMRTRLPEPRSNRLAAAKTEAINAQEQADRAQKEAVQLREQIASALEEANRAQEKTPICGSNSLLPRRTRTLEARSFRLCIPAIWRLTSGYAQLARALARVGMRRP